MQLKSLIVLAVIAIISVGFAFILVSKGYVRIGKPKDETTVSQAETAENTESAEKIKSSEVVEEEKTVDNSEAEASEQQPKMAVIPLDPIIVNLKGSFGRRYLKISVSLGVKDEAAEDPDKKKKGKEEEKGVPVKETVEGKLVEIRDILISLLSTKSIEDVDGWANQDVIRNEIREVLNKELKLDKEGISKVFFTEFVVQ